MGASMTKVDWLFLNIDGTKALATTDGPTPMPGDGRFHNGTGYTVRYVISGRISDPNDMVIATENQPSVIDGGNT